MKLPLLCACVLLYVALTHAGLLTRHDKSKAAKGSGKVPVTQNTGTSNNGRQRPLFARRGQYERQSVPVKGKTRKARVNHLSANALPPPSKALPRPAKPSCSLQGQSCLPDSGCCEMHTVCHCRFFNAICFCRKTNSLPGKKT